MPRTLRSRRRASPPTLLETLVQKRIAASPPSPSAEHHMSAYSDTGGRGRLAFNVNEMRAKNDKIQSLERALRALQRKETQLHSDLESERQAREVAEKARAEQTRSDWASFWRNGGEVAQIGAVLAATTMDWGVAKLIPALTKAVYSASVRRGRQWSSSRRTIRIRRITIWTTPRLID